MGGREGLGGREGGGGEEGGGEGGRGEEGEGEEGGGEGGGEGGREHMHSPLCEVCDERDQKAGDDDKRRNHNSHRNQYFQELA